MTNVYVAMDDELLLLRGEDGVWSTEFALSGRSPQCLAVDPRSPDRLYCGTRGHGVWCSSDAGSSWQLVGEDLAQSDVTAVAVGPGGEVYAGTEPSALFRSDNRGQTWRELSGLRELPSAPTWSFPPRPHTSHVRWITTDPFDGDTLYVCIEAGALVRSRDGGETWIDRVPDGPRDTHTLLTHREQPKRLYAAAGDGLGAPGRGYAESRDGGNTWQQPDEGLDLNYLWAVAVDPADPNTIVVSAARSARAAHNASAAESAIYRRTAGTQWAEVRTGLPERDGTTAAVLAADPSTHGVFYAVSNRGLFRSADAGLHWEQLPIDWPERYQHQRAGALLISNGAG